MCFGKPFLTQGLGRQNRQMSLWQATLEGYLPKVYILIAVLWLGHITGLVTIFIIMHHFVAL